MISNELLSSRTRMNLVDKTFKIKLNNLPSSSSVGKKKYTRVMVAAVLCNKRGAANYSLEGPPQEIIAELFILNSFRGREKLLLQCTLLKG